MTRSSKSFKVTKPFTPIRKLFLKLDSFKPTIALGKRRNRDQDHSELDPVVETPPENPKAHTHAHNTLSSILVLPPAFHVPASPKPACMALQCEDLTEDVVIITALDTIPFCCHEDLLTMSREQLITAALSLNAKLPIALHIDVSHTRPDIFIRNSIEFVVGLRMDVPPAPKAVRSRSDEGPYLPESFDEYLTMNRSPPTSPLARRSRSYDPHISLGSPRLARLEEEDEELAMMVDRPVKKRRVSASIPEEDTSTSSTLEMDMTLTFTPSPLPRRGILRTQSHRVAPSDSPTPTRVLRSHSHKLPDAMKDIKIDTAFITTSRPKYRYRCKAKDAKASTSKQTRSSSLRARTSIQQQGRPSLSYRPFLAPPVHEGSTSTSTGSINLDQDTVSDLSVDDRQMVSGIDGMNMDVGASDMDV
jgi:hypothetical protein